MTTYPISVTINGQVHTGDVPARLLLVHFIRDMALLTGTHCGCDTTSCGACTIHFNGKPVKSCTLLAVRGRGCQQSRAADALARGQRSQDGL